MSELFLQLSAEDRAEALAAAASTSGRPAHLLEKDVWVVWALSALFEAPLGEGLVFKGGTSLSKAYARVSTNVSLYGQASHRWTVDGDRSRQTATEAALGLRINW